MLLRIVAIVLAVLLTGANVVVKMALLGSEQAGGSRAYLIGALLGGVAISPLLLVSVASIWRANRTPLRLLLAANAGLALGLLVSLSRIGESMAKGRFPSAAAVDHQSVRFRKGVIDACSAKCPALSAQLGFAAARCDSFCACVADGLTELERKGAASPEAGKPVFTRCAQQAR